MSSLLGAATAVALSIVVVGTDRAPSRTGAVAITLVPTSLVAVPAMVVVAARLAG